MPSPYLYRVAPVASLLLILGTLYLTAPFRSEQRSLDVAGVEIWDQSTAQLPLVTPPGAKKRVAIIGAGVSGSASAFWLERAAREAGLKEGELELVIFERQPYVGGRSTVVYPYDDLTYPPIEVGASIFVSVNRILMRAVEHFGLNLIPWKDDEGDDRMGIWDGSAFLFITRGGVGWWDQAKILWRYGFFGPKRTLEAVAELTKTIGNVYNSTWMRQRGPWDRVEELNERLGFDVMTGKTAREYLVDDLKTGVKWADEMVEGSTRVNYAQDITDLHALVGMVSMAASGATSVLGGNRQIFQSFVEESKAVLKLNVEVTGIKTDSDDLRKWYIHTNETESSTPSTSFDAVIFAAPWHGALASLRTQIQTDTVLDRIDRAIPPQPYVHLHVTLLTTTSVHPQGRFFGMDDDAAVPTTVITSAETSRNTGSTSPDFQSITYHGRVAPDSDEWVVKIFSLERRSDEWLGEVFGKDNIGWVLRKEWDSYPKLPPTSFFPPILPLGRNSSFIYLAAQEPWISTMETQALSGRNAAAMLAEDWWGVLPGTCDGLLADGWDWTC